MGAPPPPYDEWIHYCFWQGRGHFSGTSPESAEAIEERERRFDLDALTLTDYFTRLLESPALIADRYTDHQIAAATWFIFGNEFGCFGRVFSKDVPEHLQVRCLLGMTLYTDLYDRVCGRRATDPDTDLRATDELDGAVYMVWDMGSGVEFPLAFPKNYPHLVEPSLTVLTTILDTCRTSACIISALHALGHAYSSNYDNPVIARRIQAMIDGFVARRTLPGWMLEYAAEARVGCVQ